MSKVIKIENVSKQYRLGKVGTGTLSHDLNRWWSQMLGKEDPYLKIGESNDRTKKANSDYVWALKDISFDINKGDMIGIVGRNGAGKSTLLKILSRITQPTIGSMKVNGRIASLLEVGTGFHPELTGRENVYLNGAILGMKKHEIASKFDEIVDFAGVERYIDTPVKRYSSGMYVRLAFGVAAHLQPEILIIDEVLAVGDNEFQRKSIAKMEQVCKQEGKTLIFVSHNTNAIERLCNKCVYLKQGQLVDYNTTENIIIQYNKDNYSDELLSNFTETSNLGPFAGHMKVQMTSILMYRNDSSEPTHVFQAGDKVRIEITYKSFAYENLSISQIIFGMPIFNNQDQFITVLNSKMAYKSFYNAPLEGTVICEIEKLPLMTGLHFIKANIFVDNEMSHMLTKGIAINVIEGDYYKTGFPNTGGRQGVYVSQNWTNVLG
ncbi:MAG: ABC transporter ATP-binding protein [Cytophagales bacterium]